MGIRFSCPQGHQLNVKAELAGKRGVCPRCGATVQIPERSRSLRDRAVVGAVSPDQTSVLLVEESGLPAKPQAEEEAWFARPAGGGQFGPASAADFAAWIREGRVAAEAYVWRTGWADWRRAAEAAAELPAPIPLSAAPIAAATTVLPTVQPQVEPVPIESSEPQPVLVSAHPVPRKKQSARRQLLIAVVLLIVTLVLGGILAWVLQRQSPETARLDDVAGYSHVPKVLG